MDAATSLAPLVTLTYMQFHLVFIIPPLTVLALTTSFAPDRQYTAPAGIALLVTIAVVYTTPWDSHLIQTGVWGYADGAVLARIWHVPVEEYLFFILQPLLTSLWLCRLSTSANRPFGSISIGQRALGLLGAGVVAGLGALFAFQSTYYLGTLLLWAAPPLAIQWSFGWPVLWELRRTLAIGIGVPTLYLAVADRIAIEIGIWTFDATFMTGFTLAGLPFEELLFFTLTNVFLVQGLLLFWWVTDRWPQVQTMYADLRNRAGV
jgi:lycopene cyclase domain-containing protein